MSNVSNRTEAGLELPASAPQVRITAGFGSPTQKTWNLRRPVIMIGSRRPASIVLHDREVSKAHCVIVNTGSDVLIKDLHTTSGTQCNNQRVELAALADGDVITIGKTKLQIAIQQPPDRSAEDSGCGMEFVDPVKLPNPMILRLEHTEQEWKIEDAAALLGKHEQSAVRLDHAGLSPREAVVFRYSRSPAIFDISGRDGISVNGKRCSMAALALGDRIGLGPFTLIVHEGAPTTQEVLAQAGHADTPSNAKSEPAKENREDDPLHALHQIEADLSSLEKSISVTWERFNTDEKPPSLEPAGVTLKSVDLESRAKALDARDAMLRGQMHDLTRYHEQLAGKERDLVGQLSQIQARRDELTSMDRSFQEREADIQKRHDELKRREHVLAQRWSRLLSAMCPHCGQPVNITPPGGTEAL